MNEPKQPNCEECGSELQCRNCNDTRPKAENIYAGWRLLTPLGTWETVARIKQENDYSPVFVWTEERPDFAWEYARWKKVDAVSPGIRLHGTPEVRFWGGIDRGTSMMVCAILDTEHLSWSMPGERILAQAGNGGRGIGWWIQAQDGSGEAKLKAVAKGLTKDQAKAELKRLGRDFAKRLKVKFRVQE